MSSIATISSYPALATVPLEKRRFCQEDLRLQIDNASRYLTTITHDESRVTTDHALRFLCLHGWRTSGDILRMQSAALRAYLQLDCVFPNALFCAEGPPDDGVATFYPDMDYFEWYFKDDRHVRSIDENLSYLVQFIQKHGPFDGILGFSQGASFATMLADRLSTEKGISSNVKYIILIGGVNPPASHAPRSPLQIKSLHLMGLLDEVLERSKALKDMFAPELATVIEHAEGHNIPSIRTDTYHAIKKWVWEDEGYEYKVRPPVSSGSG